MTQKLTCGGLNRPRKVLSIPDAGSRRIPIPAEMSTTAAAGPQRLPCAWHMADFPTPRRGKWVKIRHLPGLPGAGSPGMYMVSQNTRGILQGWTHSCYAFR